MLLYSRDLPPVGRYPEYPHLWGKETCATRASKHGGLILWATRCKNGPNARGRVCARHVNLHLRPDAMVHVQMGWMHVLCVPAAVRDALGTERGAGAYLFLSSCSVSLQATVQAAGCSSSRGESGGDTARRRSFQGR